MYSQAIMKWTATEKLQKSKKARKLASEYCLQTSAHGVSNVVSSTHVAQKVGWIIILCGVLFGSSYHILSMLLSYLEYNFYTSVTLDREKPLMVRMLKIISMAGMAYRLSRYIGTF